LDYSRISVFVLVILILGRMSDARTAECARYGGQRWRLPHHRRALLVCPIGAENGARRSQRLECAQTRKTRRCGEPRDRRRDTATWCPGPGSAGGP